MNIIRIKSPNYRRRRSGFRPEAIVLHITDGSMRGTISWFKDPASGVSAHYGVSMTGLVYRFVDDDNTAWHAGRVFNPTWTLLKRVDEPYPRRPVNPNSYTLGIEVEATARDRLFPNVQTAATALVIADLCHRWAIPLDRPHIIGHREIFAAKDCPGHLPIEALIALARKPAQP